MTTKTTSTPSQREYTFGEAWKGRFDIDEYELPADFDIRNKQAEIEKRTEKVALETFSHIANPNDVAGAIGCGILSFFIGITIIGIPIAYGIFKRYCKNIAKDQVKTAIADKRIEILSNILNPHPKAKEKGKYDHAVNIEEEKEKSKPPYDLKSKAVEIKTALQDGKIFGKKAKALAQQIRIYNPNTEITKEDEKALDVDNNLDLVCMIKELNNEQKSNVKKWKSIISGEMYNLITPEDAKKEYFKTKLKTEIEKAKLELNSEKAAVVLDQAKSDYDQEVINKTGEQNINQKKSDLDKAKQAYDRIPEANGMINLYYFDCVTRSHEETTINGEKIEAGLSPKTGLFKKLKSLVETISTKHKIIDKNKQNELFILLQIAATQTLKNTFIDIATHIEDGFISGTEKTFFNNIDFKLDDENNNLLVTFDILANFQSSNMHTMVFNHGKDTSPSIYSANYKFRMVVDLEKVQKSNNIVDDCLSIKCGNLKFSTPHNHSNDNSISSSLNNQTQHTNNETSNSPSNNLTQRWLKISPLFFYHNINMLLEDSGDFDTKYETYLENREKYPSIADCAKQTGLTKADIVSFDKKLMKNIGSTLLKIANPDSDEYTDIPLWALKDINQKLNEKNSTNKNIISNLKDISKEPNYKYAKYASDLWLILASFSDDETIIKLKQYCDVIKKSDESKLEKDKAFSILKPEHLTLIEILTKDLEIPTESKKEEEAIIQAPLPENQSLSPDKVTGATGVFDDNENTPLSAYSEKPAPRKPIQTTQTNGSILLDSTDVDDDDSDE